MIAAVSAAIAAAAPPAAPGALPAYSTTQASRGMQLYSEKCLLCHGPDLAAGQFGPSLKGTRFRRAWGGKPVAELFVYLSRNMPPGKAPTISPEDHADLLAFILQGNGVAGGRKPLPSDPEAMTGIVPR